MAGQSRPPCRIERPQYDGRQLSPVWIGELPFSAVVAGNKRLMVCVVGRLRKTGSGDLRRRLSYDSRYGRDPLDPCGRKGQHCIEHERGDGHGFR